MELAGLRALVTGGANGIGLSIVAKLAGAGARVHVCDVNEGSLRAVSADIENVSISRCDVTDRAGVALLFEETIAELGGIDCLVNNVGIAGPTGRVDEIDPNEWDKTLQVNMTGQFNCSRLAVAPLLKSSNPSIINMSSAAGRLGFRNRSAYAASKWAVVGFTKSLSMELGPHGIRVNAVLPGTVAGERQDAVLRAKGQAEGVTLEQMRQRALERTSIPEFVSPEEIADTVLFLVSPAGKRISGQAISVCGDLQSLI